jgi:crossover junction endodeoxyribonuclease RuvC
MPAKRILGIDPSVRSTGYAVIETNGRDSRAVAFGRVRNTPSLSQSACLLNIYNEIRDVIELHKPEEAAVEGIIYVQNRNTAIAMGSARGSAMVAIAEKGLPLYEYPAKTVKKSSTGFGQAGKTQVGFMIGHILGVKSKLTPDEADALAIALTHAQQSGVSKQKRI